MKTLLQAGARAQEVSERPDLEFCFIGGVANFRWGTPRSWTRAGPPVEPRPS